MGMPHDSISHISLVQERCGTSAFGDIEADPADYIKYARTFVTADTARLSNTYPNIGVVEKGTCSACSATIVAFIKTHGHKFPGDVRFTLATGANLTSEDLEGENVILVGKCAGESGKAKGMPFCKGCPPVGSSILAFMRGEDDSAE